MPFVVLAYFATFILVLRGPPPSLPWWVYLAACTGAPSAAAAFIAVGAALAGDVRVAFTQATWAAGVGFAGKLLCLGTESVTAQGVAEDDRFADIHQIILQTVRV